MAAPSFYPAQFQLHWIDILAPIGIGGIWLAIFLQYLRGRSLLPLHDPRFAELLEGVQKA